MARAEARFFDGESAVAHEVELMLSADSLVFSGPDVTQRSWPLAGLEAVSWLAPAEPLRLTHSSAPGTRLVIGDDAFRRELIRAAPQAGGAVNYRRIAEAAGLTAA